MIVLGIETSSSRGSLCLLDDSTKVLGQRTWQRLKSHTEVVTFELENLLTETSIKIRDLGLVSVGIGPGSFTGLRVGINLARSLGYALNIEVAAIDSLRLVAEPALQQGRERVLVMTNAFKNMVYASLFEDGQEVLPPSALTLDELEPHLSSPTVVVGDGYEVFKPYLSNRLKEVLIRRPGLEDHPSAKTACELAVNNSQLGVQRMSWNQLKPLYIRASEAEEKLRDGLLKPLPEM